MFDDLGGSVLGQGGEHGGGQPWISGDAAGIGNIDAWVMRGLLNGHAEIGDEAHDLSNRGQNAPAA